MSLLHNHADCALEVAVPEWALFHTGGAVLLPAHLVLVTHEAVELTVNNRAVETGSTLSWNLHSYSSLGGCMVQP